MERGEWSEEERKVPLSSDWNRPRIENGTWGRKEEGGERARSTYLLEM